MLKGGTVVALKFLNSVKDTGCNIQILVYRPTVVVQVVCVSIGNSASHDVIYTADKILLLLP